MKKKMAKKDLVFALKYGGLSGKARGLLCAFFIMRNRNGCCCLNYRDLMDISGIGNRNTMADKISELVECGVLLVENQYNEKTNSREMNKYTLVSV